MTTIAFRDGVIAADSWTTHEGAASGSYRSTCTKLYRKSITSGKKKHDVIIATAGESSPSLLFVDWYGTSKPIPPMLLQHGGEFYCLILEPSGLYEVDGYLRPDKITAPFYALGSGAKAALAAMHCGKSAIEAVRIAARIDPYTGGRIVYDSLDKSRSNKRGTKS